MTLYVLLALVVFLLGGLLMLLWHLWANYTQRTPEDEELEREIASLNDAQANRVSDQQLTRPVTPDDAWQTMVKRGGPAPRRWRKRRP